MKNFLCFILAIVLINYSAISQINNQISYSYETNQIVDPTGVHADQLGGKVKVLGNYLFATTEGIQAVSIFKRTDASAPWVYYKKIYPADVDPDSDFAESIAVQGDYLVVGAPDHGPYSFTEYGRVYIYKKDFGGVDNWGQVKTLRASDSTDNGNFGNAVGVFGDRIIVGGSGLKQAYLFEKDFGGIDNWGEKQIFTSPAASRVCGQSVFIHNTTIFVGGGWYGSGYSSYAGEVQVFDKDNGGIDNWGLTKTIIEGRNTFGTDMDYDGTNLIVASPRYNYGAASTHAGNAYILSKDLGGVNNWGLVKELEASNTTDLYFFGQSVALDGDHALVGAVIGFGTPDQAYRFDKDFEGVDNWGQYGILLPSDGNYNENFDEALEVQGKEFYAGSAWAYIGADRPGKIFEFSADSCFTIFTQVYDTIYYDEVVVFGSQLCQYQGQYFDSLVTADGCDSIVVLNLDVESKISFEDKWDFAAGNGTFDVALGDLNGDGKIDMVSANYGAGNISIFQNQTAVGVINPATFMPSFTLTSGVNTSGVEIFDVDGDGKNDIVSIAYNSDSLYVFRNIGPVGGFLSAAHFAPKQAFLTGNGPRDIEIGDFDEDGKTDIVVLNHWDQTISVIKNVSSPGTIFLAPKLDYSTWNEYGESLTVGDLSGDGKIEIAVTIHDYGAIGSFHNQSVVGGISFQSIQYLHTAGGNPGSAQIGDFNGDNCNDLLQVGYASGTRTNSFQSNCPSGPVDWSNYLQEFEVDRFDSYTSSGFYGYMSKLSDLDLNGKKDLVFTMMHSSTWGRAHFMANIYNNDPIIDTLDFHSEYVKYYPTNRTGMPSFVSSNRPVYIRMGDIDNDGLEDLCVTNYGDNKVMVFKNSSLTSGVLPGDTIATNIVGGGTNYCAGDTVKIAFTSSATFSSGNNFVAQLSDASGSFASAVSIGTLSGTTIDTITCVLPGGTVYGTGYRIRVLSTSSYLLGADNGIDLTINESQYTNISASICSGDSYLFGVQTLTVAGSYTDIFTSANGCDSTVTLNLVVNNSNAGSETIAACDSYTWSANTTTYTASGSYTATLTNAAGCDSIATLNLTINTNTAGSENVTACNSYAWSANTTTYTASGSYTATLTNAAGCDSIATLNLTINTSNAGLETVTACDSYTWSANTTTYTASGSYTATLTNAAGCDSIATLNLTINTSNAGSENVTACDSYTWSANTTTYAASGSYTATLTNAAGCDSIATLNLTINNSNAGSENVTACDSYTWSANTTTYTASGSYTATLTNAAGCDSIATLNLTINTSNAGSENVTACDSYTWSANTTTYTASGSYTVTLTNAAGCDSIATLNLTINSNTAGSETISACDSYTWSANTTTYTASGSYTATLTNAAGCDSIATLNLTINNSNAGSENVTACDSYTWSANTTTYTASGSYTATLTNAAGCDSIATLNLTITNTVTGSESIVACDSYTWSANTTTYTASGSYTATLTNAAGCDSIATLNLTINNSNAGSESVTACDSYTWSANTTTYTASGSYNATLTNAAGCDSIATLNLTINTSNAGSENVTACDSYTWSANTTTYTASGSYTATLTNAAGCDSIATLNLTINNSNAGSESVTACDSYTWSANTTTYTASGSYTATLTNAAGCDSIATLNLTINNSNVGSENVTACDSYTWSANTTTYTASGSYTATLTNAAGCDSIATLNLTINNSNAGSETVTACDSYTWSANTTTYTASGSYTATLTNAAGCDSIATLNLTINNATTSTSTMTTCDSYSWNGTTYTSTGAYTWTGTNAAGCDSVATLNLTINNATTSTSAMTACDLYMWNGTTYASTGTYTWTGTNAAGCDSVATLNLTINNATTSTSAMTSCDSHTWNGTTYTIPGTYTWTGTNAAGCDSVATLYLTINNATTSTSSMTACGSYMWNGTSYTSSGAYTWTGTNAAGCDSIATLNLTINNATTSTSAMTACDSYLWNGTTYTSSGAYTWIGTNAAGCDSVATLDLTINTSTSGSEDITECLEYTWVANGTTYTSSGTYVETLTGASGCDSIATLNLTIITIDLTVTNTSGVLEVAEDPAVYQWLDCAAGYTIIAGATSQSYTPTVSGEYAAVVTANGCTDTTTCVSIDDVGIDTPLFGANIRLYPNPTTGNFTIALDKEYQAVQLVLYDALGKMVEEYNYENLEAIEMTISRAPGVYFIDLRTEDGFSTRLRIVKK